MVNPNLGGESHLSAGEVSAYLDRALPETARARMQEHLAECDECRHEVVELSRLLRTRPARQPVVRWAIAAGIAATLAIMVGRLPGGLGTSPVPGPLGPVERGLSSVEATQLSARGPTRGAVVHRDSLIFTWSAARGSGVQYRVTVSDSDGRTLWTASTPDTIFSPPLSLTFPPGQVYYWYTDALLPDGRSLTTGVQEFRMAP